MGEADGSNKMKACTVCSALVVITTLLKQLQLINLYVSCSREFLFLCSQGFFCPHSPGVAGLQAGRCLALSSLRHWGAAGRLRGWVGEGRGEVSCQCEGQHLSEEQKAWHISGVAKQGVSQVLGHGTVPVSEEESQGKVLFCGYNMVRINLPLPTSPSSYFL